MDAATLALFAGSVLSLIFSYVPGLQGLYDQLTADYKRVVMLVALLLTAAGVYGLSCGGFIDVGVVCDKPGLIELVKVFFTALIANQGTYSLTKKSAPAGLG